MSKDWYTSKKIRELLQISPQCLYMMKASGRIEFRKVSDRTYLYKLPKSFEKSDDRNIAIYSRVLTPKQKKDLDNQISMLKQYVVARGNEIDNSFVFSDIASGMNEKRKSLDSLISEIISGNVKEVVVSNRDRLTRFGFGYFKTLFEKFDCKITEVNLTEDKTFEQELTDDLIAIIHHFSMKFYGKRKNVLKKFEKDIASSEEFDK